MGRSGKLWLAALLLVGLLVAPGLLWAQKLPPTKLEFSTGSQKANQPAVQQQVQQNQVQRQQRAPKKIKSKANKDYPKRQGPAKPMRGAPVGASRQ